MEKNKAYLSDLGVIFGSLEMLSTYRTGNGTYTGLFTYSLTLNVCYEPLHTVLNVLRRW